MPSHRAAIAVGPKAAGKTTFCQLYADTRPGTVLVRPLDEAAKESIDEGILWKTMAQNLRSPADKDTMLILDCHHDDPAQRKATITRLHALGIADVEAWYFVTPEHVCVKWFMEREEREERALTDPRDRKWRSLFRVEIVKALRHDHARFPFPTVQEGFSRIRKIDPLAQNLRSFCH